MIKALRYDNSLHGGKTTEGQSSNLDEKSNVNLSKL